jgi:hypothetical protein
MARVGRRTEGKQNPELHTARGVNPSSYTIIIGSDKCEVNVTLMPAVPHLSPPC